MRILAGYNCTNMNLPSFKIYKSSDVSSGNIKTITEVIDHNIQNLGDILEFNARNGIHNFRMPSSIIPFMSSKEFQKLATYEGFLLRPCVVNEVVRIRRLLRDCGMELSFHPGQYNVLNSKDPKVVSKTIRELETQTQLLRLFNGSTLVLHIGGIYWDKASSLKRFITHTDYLSDNVMRVLTIENDDKSFNTDDVIDVLLQKDLKWVLDFHHEKMNPSKSLLDNMCYKLPMKYHVSQGTSSWNYRAHDDWVDVSTLNEYLLIPKRLGVNEVTLMFEAKKKNQAIFDVLQPMGHGYFKVRDTNLRFQGGASYEK